MKFQLALNKKGCCICSGEEEEEKKKIPKMKNVVSLEVCYK
jgi:hypothetical protein